jgi:glycosyltransferase involved in cell wall biosynthesis
MTILHFSTHLCGGGAEMMLCNLVEQCRRPGIRQIIISLKSHIEDPTVQRIHQAADKVHYLNSPTFCKPSTLLALWRLLRHYQPDIVQTWMHKPDLVGGIVARLAGCRNVFWAIHAMDVSLTAGAGGIATKLLRFALAAASRLVPRAILSCSQKAAERHVAFGYAKQKMRYVPNGMDAQRFQPNPSAREKLRSELKIPQKAPCFGFVGRFSEVKDLPTFLRAAGLLMIKHPSAHFVCVGHPQGDQSSIKQATAAIPDPTRLHWLPFRSDVENVYAALDCLTLTSLSEAYPMVLIEAMACGVPCVSTNVGDAPLMLPDPAQIVPVGDSAAICVAWEHILANPQPAEDVRALVVPTATLERCAQSYLELYRSVLPSPPALPSPHTP